MKLYAHYLGLITLLFSLFWMNSCKKDNDFFSGNAKISTSTDTLLFDTVFTQVGSATRYFKIYNNEKNPVQIELYIDKGKSFFRMNADGFSGNHLKNVEIPANDSIYVFVETTINPDAPLSSSPFIVDDLIVIRQGENQFTVSLIAFGQNANYIPKVGGKGLVTYLTCNLGSIAWDDAKPYVIYGVLVIDSCEIVIPEGKKIYVHGGVVVNKDEVYNDGQIIVLSRGKLTINGSANNKVVIEGDRLEKEFNEVAGQWGGIRFFAGSKNNSINHAIIRNAIVGCIVDSSASLDVKSTTIENCSAYGIYGSHCTINASNLLIHSTGSHAINLTYGGNYNFNFCTLNTNINQDESIILGNYRCTNPLCAGKILLNKLVFSMKNSIVSGGSEDEILLNPAAKEHIGNLFNYSFANCAVRVKDLLEAENFPDFFDNCPNCITIQYNEKLFQDVNENNYLPDSMFIGLNKGVFNASIPFDLRGKIRDTATPDIGCYEL